MLTITFKIIIISNYTINTDIFTLNFNFTKQYTEYKLQRGIREEFDEEIHYHSVDKIFRKLQRFIILLFSLC